MTELLQEKIRRRAKTDFTYFVNEIFSHSYGILKDGKWTGGEYINEISTWLGDRKTTIRVSARDHFKSMSFYAHIMWKLLKYEDKDHEIQYFSFNNKMAAYHTQKIKLAIDSNPFFNKIKVSFSLIGGLGPTTEDPPAPKIPTSLYLTEYP